MHLIIHVAKVRLCVVFNLVHRVARSNACTQVMGILNVTPDSFSDGGAVVF